MSASALLACATVPASMSELAWADLQGDRGAGVAQRDLAACLDAVESRRNLIRSCMQAHGWAPLPP